MGAPINRSARPLKLSAEYARKGGSIASRDGVGVAMASAADNFRASSPDRVDRAAPRRENPAIERKIAASICKREVVAIECDDVGAGAGDDAAIDAERLGAAKVCRLEQPSAHGG